GSVPIFRSEKWERLLDQGAGIASALFSVIASEAKQSHEITSACDSTPRDDGVAGIARAYKLPRDGRRAEGAPIFVILRELLFCHSEGTSFLSF
uniref:hypothetical protein n=1 Tax=Thermodesulfatator atlanticus TaxID=501497 RepID=UPI0005248107